MIYAVLCAAIGFVGTNVVWWLRVRDLTKQLRAYRGRRPPPPLRDPMTRTQRVPVLNYFPFFTNKELHDEQ